MCLVRKVFERFCWLINIILFKRLVAKKRYIEALAKYSHFPSTNGVDALGSMYRLGLYETVVKNCSSAETQLTRQIALAVSYAACGKGEKSEHIVQSIIENRLSLPKRISLASGLAAFDPRLAIKLLDSCNATHALHAALLLRIGKREQAAELLDKITEDSSEANNPELLLLLCNANKLNSQQQLSSLNQFLEKFDMPELGLVQNSMLPGPMNLLVTKALPTVSGPLITILMTAYESGKWIGSAIHSVQKQTYQNIELIVVDDASSDNTESIVRSIAEQDSRVMYVRLPINVGTYVAKSIGLKYASGEFVTCHDSDDWAHPLKIERQIAPLLKNSRVVATTSHFLRMTERGEYYARQIFPLMRLNSSSVLFRREKVLEHAGGWDLVRTGADSEFLARLKLVFGPKSVCGVKEPLTLGAHRSDSLMTAVETGYSSAGVSPTRLSYWESWNYWHINETRSGRKPKIDTDLKAPRTYAAPENICVPLSEIENCIDSVCSQFVVLNEG